MLLRLIIVFTSLCLPFSAKAEQLAASTHFAVECDPKVCAATDAQITSDQADHIVQTMEGILAWFKRMGYPASKLPKNNDGRFVITISSNDACGRHATACTRRLISNPRILLPLNSLSSERLEGSLAHEYFHTLNLGPGSQPKLLSGSDSGCESSTNEAWLDEATATAVGEFWLGQSNLASPDYPPRYPMDLDIPFYCGSQEGYEKGLYFRYVAEKHNGGQEPMSYLAVLPGQFRSYVNPDNMPFGMGLLYNRCPNCLGINGADFSVAFPYFVARYNNTGHFRLHRDTENEDGSIMLAGTMIDQFNYYSDISMPKIGPFRIDAPSAYSFEGSVAAYAVEPILLNNVSFDVPRDVNDRDALVRFGILMDPGPIEAGLNLVHEHRVAPSINLDFALRAEPDMDLGFIRIVSAPDRGVTPQTFSTKLLFDVQPIEIPDLSCIWTGERVDFDLNGELGRTENYLFTASDGFFDGTVFNAPKTAGNVSINLEIKSLLTRSSYGIDIAQHPSTHISLGDVTIGNCGVRMILPDGSTLTWDDRSDTTEMDMNGERMIATGKYFYIFDGMSGWLRLNIAQASGIVPDYGAIASGGDQDFAFRTPKAMSEMLPYNKRPFGAIEEPVACPNGEEGCVIRSLTGIGGMLFGADIDLLKVVYDRNLRLAALRTPDGDIRFEYGQFDVAPAPVAFTDVTFQ